MWDISTHCRWFNIPGPHALNASVASSSHYEGYKDRSQYLREKPRLSVIWKELESVWALSVLFLCCLCLTHCIIHIFSLGWWAILRGWRSCWIQFRLLDYAFLNSHENLCQILGLQQILAMTSCKAFQGTEKADNLLSLFTKHRAPFASSQPRLPDVGLFIPYIPA